MASASQDKDGAALGRSGQVPLYTLRIAPHPTYESAQILVAC